MLSFTSLTFLFIFLPVSLVGFFLVSRTKNEKALKIYLLVFSLLFWACIQADTLPFLIMLVALLFTAGTLLEATNEANAVNQDSPKYKRKTWILFFAIFAAVVLFYYKLMPIFVEYKWTSADKIILPIGLSFVIFSAISYLVDVYRGASVGKLIDVALYVTFFPKLLSGPIVLWKDFKMELNVTNCVSMSFGGGIERICIGYAKKAIIADTLGAKIATIHSLMPMYAADSNAALQLPGADVPTYWICALLYMFQIYYDFAGYSDIAIGLSKVFGFNIKENFNYPYVSKSLGEFWRRWHISLGTWFREYVYIPLGGNRTGNVYVNLFVVFLLTGIWHGIGWTFLLWGVLNGIAVMVERFGTRHNYDVHIPLIIKHIYFIIAIYFLWILFSSDDIFSFVDYLKGMVHYRNNAAPIFEWQYFLDSKTVIVLIIAALGAFVGNVGKVKDFCEKFFSTSHGEVVSGVGCLIIFLISMLFMVNSTYSPFIYFQF